jgi:hypothetical protein
MHQAVTGGLIDPEPINGNEQLVKIKAAQPNRAN